MAAVTQPAPSETRTRRVQGPLLWLAEALTVVVLATALFLAWFNWDMLRGPVARQASLMTGRNVRIDGHLAVHPWSWTPTATVSGLKIGNPAWMGGGDTADVDQFTVAVKLWPLLFGDLQASLVRAERPRLWLYRDATGRVNWRMGRDGQPARLPPIENIALDDGRLTYVDRIRRLVVVGTVQSNQSLAGRGTFRLVGHGAINSNPFLVTISGAPLINVRHDRPYPFAADIRAGATRIVARGALPKPFDFGLIRSDLVVSGQNLASLYDLTGLALPNTPPYRLTGELERDGTRWTFHKVSGVVGSSDLEGAFQLDHHDGRPDLHATLSSRRMTIADLGTLLGAPPHGPGKTAAQQADAARLSSQSRLLPDAQLAVGRVRAMDADVHYRAASVQAGPHLPLTGFALHLVLDHGVMTADPVAFDMPHGSLAGRVRVDARRDVPATDLDMRLSNIHAEDFFRTSANPPLSGLIEARAKLHGVGGSVHAAASTASGSLAVVAPGGQIRQSLAELMGVDVIKGLGLYLAHDQRPTGVRCAVADFQANGGVLTARNLVLDTDPVLATGKGSINLATERLDLQLQGHPKRFQLIRLASPVTVSGALKAPKVGVKAGAAPLQAAIGVALGALVSPVAAILPFIDPGLHKNADCGALVAEAQSRGAPVRATAR